jgi:hypothetical protein
MKTSIKQFTQNLLGNISLHTQPKVDKSKTVDKKKSDQSSDSKKTPAKKHNFRKVSEEFEDRVVFNKDVYINNLEKEIKMLSEQLIKVTEELDDLKKLKEGQSNLSHNLIIENQRLKKTNDLFKAKTPEALLKRISGQQDHFDAEKSRLQKTMLKNAANYELRIKALEESLRKSENTISELMQKNSYRGPFEKVNRKLNNLIEENKKLMLSLTKKKTQLKLLNEKLAKANPKRQNQSKQVT